MKQKKVLTVQQAALQLGVTLKYVRDLLYEQRLPGAYKQGREWRIPSLVVERWMKVRRDSNA